MKQKPIWTRARHISWRRRNDRCESSEASADFHDLHEDQKGYYDKDGVQRVKYMDYIEFEVDTDGTKESEGNTEVADISKDMFDRRRRKSSVGAAAGSAPLPIQSASGGGPMPSAARWLVRRLVQRQVRMGELFVWRTLTTMATTCCPTTA